MTRRIAGPTAGPPPIPPGTGSGTGRQDLARIPDRLRARGLRWTPQRAILLDALARAEGHVTGSTLVERCRELDPATTPSTVYRTLDVLEELGVISHSHGIDGREAFHVLPVLDHGHLICSGCGMEDELPAPEAAPFLEALEARHGFQARIDHLTVVGRCRDCRAGDDAGTAPATDAPRTSTTT
jgi:Fur family ferric uptake transcriptional regulator